MPSNKTEHRGPKAILWAKTEGCEAAVDGGLDLVRAAGSNRSLVYLLAVKLVVLVCK